MSSANNLIGLSTWFVTPVKILALPATPSSPHVLFVDDEPQLRRLMAERMEERGFDVVEADSGEQALELLDQFAYDIVITDLRLPGIDGTRESLVASGP